MTRPSVSCRHPAQPGHHPSVLPSPEPPRALWNHSPAGLRGHLQEEQASLPQAHQLCRLELAAPTGQQGCRQPGLQPEEVLRQARGPCGSLSSGLSVCLSVHLSVDRVPSCLVFCHRGFGHCVYKRSLCAADGKWPRPVWRLHLVGVWGSARPSLAWPAGSTL